MKQLNYGEILSKFLKSNLILKNSATGDKNYKKYLIKKFKNKIDENRIFLYSITKKTKRNT